MATKEKIKKKKKNITPAPAKDNKDTESEVGSQDSIPVIVKTADESNIIDNVEKDNVVKEMMVDKDDDIEIIKDKSESRIDKDQTSKSKDGIFEKKDQEKERSRSPSVLSVTSRRSSSPFSRNVVEPAPIDGSTTNMGSAVSLRSNISAKEAWSVKSDSSNTNKKRLKSATSTTTIVSKIESNKNKKPDDTVSLRSKTSVENEQRQNAYIPYVYARNCIKQITQDMENMKINHIRIVHDIEENYRTVEDETQNQFNMFVLCLRQQYSGNVKTFKQVIEVHRTELNTKEIYWKDLFTSLTGRNNKMLREKKVLLMKHKLDIDKLVKEKEEMKIELIAVLDKTNASVTQVEKDPIEKMELEKLEKDNKELSSELEKDKTEISRLNDLLLDKSDMPIVATSADSLTSKRDDTEKQTAVAMVMVGKEEKEQMVDERDQISKERSDFLDERQRMHEDREMFNDERKSFIEEMRKLQEEIRIARKVSVEWEAKYSCLKTDLGDSLTLQSKYEALKSQYLALSAIVASTTESSRTAAKENEEKSKSERDMMDSEKKRLQDEINEWEKTFEEKNKRAPTDDDKPDSAKELYVSLGEVDSMVDSLDKKIETLQKVQNGIIPDPPQVTAVPLVIKDPQIKMVEVMVPDPSVVEDLKKSQEEVESLQTRIAVLQQDKTDLNVKLSDINTDVSTCKSRITELEVALALARESHTTTSVPAQSQLEEEITELNAKLQQKDEELDKLRKENEGMIKDMKKMMKRYNKLEVKLKESGVDENDARLLQAVAAVVKDIHNEVPTASEKVDIRLKEVGSDKNLNETEKEIKVQALNIIKTGVYKTDETQTIDNKELEKQVTELDERIIDLESENEILKSERDQNMEKVIELERQISDLKNQVIPAIPDDTSTASLIAERSAHDSTKAELENLEKELMNIKEENTSEKIDLQNQIESNKKSSEAQIKTHKEELSQLRKRSEELEKERLANMPVDTANEIKILQKKIIVLEKDKVDGNGAKVVVENKVIELQSKLDQAVKNLNTQKTANKDFESKIKAVRSEKEKAVKELSDQLKKKEERPGLERKKTSLVGKGVPDPATKALKEQLMTTKRENTELNNRIKLQESEIKKLGKGDVDSVDKQMKRHEKILKELEKKYEMEKSKNDKNIEKINGKDEEIKTLNKDCMMKNSEIEKLNEELESLGLAAKEGIKAAVKVKSLETDNKHLIGENKVLIENFNTERVLRKKYYNMVEDMKGKIRVYCRARPLSTAEKERGNVSVIVSPDEYSLNISSIRGLKEFQFDQVFMEDSSQEKVFEDTNNLIQSAVDGYNVCMFAYGQTGSGKTFTMIGDREQRFPGVAPRAFQRIFELADENKHKFNMKVSTYMLELYNEKLIDLFAKSGTFEEDKLDIKKDQKGMVVIQGSVVKEATNHKQLFALFEEGSKNRHVASTKMNAESSRSHLVIGVVIESVNKLTGQIIKGKLSLVDLAGSERVGKTGATAEQLKEAMSINKSLSALGDVISALSSEQSFIPYRNNKLTMLMQDSLGGNAKTLMFVNISPADYNQDESVVSLTYASRVKLITNDASKNSDNKEIGRLKSIIQKLKEGLQVDEDD